MSDQIKLIHSENLNLITKYNITKGSFWTLKSSNNMVPEIFEVTTIHGLYGWLRFNNTDTNVPQRVSEFLRLYKRVQPLGCEENGDGL